MSALPIDEIQRTVHPTGDQVAALDDLRAASEKAEDILKASCPSAIPLTPIARLDTAEKRLDAMIDAIQIVRPALERFYGSLSDEQKRRFDTMNAAGTAERNSLSGAGNLAALCAEPAGGLAKLPLQRIDQVLAPDPQQQGALDALKQASDKAAQDVASSCPREMPRTLRTPVARLEAAATRLGAMIDAMKSIRPKLLAFYDSLSDEQKAKFNTLAPPQNAPLQAQQQPSSHE